MHMLLSEKAHITSILSAIPCIFLFYVQVINPSLPLLYNASVQCSFKYTLSYHILKKINLVISNLVIFYNVLETFPSIGRVRVKHRGMLLTIKGTIIRSGAMKMIEGERIYECRRCKHRLSLCASHLVILLVSILPTRLKIIEIFSQSINGIIDLFYQV